MMCNLPPGVTDAMLPGNTAEDAAYDAFADRLGSVLTTPLPEDEFERLLEFVWQELEGAHTSGYYEGYRASQADDAEAAHVADVARATTPAGH